VVVPGQLCLFEQKKTVEQSEAEVTEVKPHRCCKGEVHPGTNPLPEHLPEEQADDYTQANWYE